MKIGNRIFDTEHGCYLMGILNVTPDSFSDGGKWNDLGRAKEHVGEMISEGASIIDIGGESTRPGHTRISAEEEIARVVPAIRMVKEHFDIPVSIDSYKGEVVEAALEAGADLVNDIWGFKADRRVAEITARYHVPCCLMHNRREPIYRDFMEDVKDDLRESVRIALDAGVRPDQIVLDPGVGFGKNYEHNLAVIHRLKELRGLGYPLLMAASRKSVIGLTLDLPSEQRLEGTLAITVISVLQGASFIRVHDVKENYRAVKMTQAVMAEGVPAE